MSHSPQHPSGDEKDGANLIPEDNRDPNEFHGSIAREKSDPQTEIRPLSGSLITLFCLIILGAALYLGTHSGGFKSDVFDAGMTSTSASRNSRNQSNPIANGRRLFMGNCFQCHQANGLGVPNEYPPLAGSEIAQSQQGWGANHLVMILLNGLQGPITVKNGIFKGEMPAHREKLNDEQIADILTYIRQEWGNTASPIGKEEVAAIRAEIGSRIQPWTEPELKAIPAKNSPSPVTPNPSETRAGAPEQPTAPEPKY